MDSVARRRSARTARVALAPASVSAPALGWRPWASLLCHLAVRVPPRCLHSACVAAHASADVSRGVAAPSRRSCSPCSPPCGCGTSCRPLRPRCRATRGSAVSPGCAVRLQRCRALSRRSFRASRRPTRVPHARARRAAVPHLLQLHLAARGLDARRRHRRGAPPSSQPPSRPLSRDVRPSCAGAVRSRLPPHATQATLLRRAGGAGCALSAALDDAACAALPIATAVTMLYYALLTANPGFVEEPCVPAPLARAVSSGRAAA